MIGIVMTPKQLEIFNKYKRMAGNLIRIRVDSLPLNIGVDDLFQAGMLGLIDGIIKLKDGYSPKQVTSYLKSRILGSIGDYIRSESPYSRDELKMLLKELEDNNLLETQRGRCRRLILPILPKSDNNSGVTEEKVYDLNSVRIYKDRTEKEVELIEMWRCADKLPIDLKLVFTVYCKSNLSMDEVGKIFGLKSGSVIYRLRKAVVLIKQMMKGYHREDTKAR